MKIFTIISSILIVLLMVAALVYVGASPDFVAPGENGPGGAGADDPVWDMTMDDLVNYLAAKGYIDPDAKQLLASGVATECFKYGSLELCWWDVENLEEGTAEYDVYQDLIDDDGVVLIYGNYPYSITWNGPFGLHANADYTGDINQLIADFLALGRPGAEDRSAPVWSMTMDDILAYFMEKGLLTSLDDTWPMSDGVGTVARGFNGAEIYWWDVDNLEEGSDEAAAWENMNKDGMIDLWQRGTMFMPVTQNGPFGMFLNGNGDDKALLEAFQSFGREAAPANTEPSESTEPENPGDAS